MISRVASMVAWLSSAAVAAPAAMGQDYWSSVFAKDRDKPTETTPATPASPLTRAQRVDRAVERATQYLLAIQNGDGTWTSQPLDRDNDLQQTNDGLTALATLSLLSSGVSPQAPEIRRAVDHLLKAKLDRVYTVSLRACVLASLPGNTREKELRRDVDWLDRAMIHEGPLTGHFGFLSASEHPVINNGGIGDLSDSQYGMLGAWFADEAGVALPDEFWRRAGKAWRTIQRPDGGWAYQQFGDNPSFTSMTAGGVASLFLADAHLNTIDALALDDAAGTDANAHDKDIARAIHWLDTNAHAGRNVSSTTQPSRGADRHVFYTLFNLERVAEASGITTLGGRNWYDEGTDYLLSSQHPDGSYAGSPSGFETADTAYALLFLSRGRAPVAVQKLQLGDRWNNRPRDAANLTRWLRRQTERHLNWQVVSADATVEQWQESPILYLAGDRPIHLTSDQKARLKTYLDNGGLLLCVNEGKFNAFARSAEMLGRELYPQYAFRDLPKDHALLNENFSMGTGAEPVRGLSNGVRELIVVQAEGDLTWHWHANKYDDNPLAAFPLFGNLYLYATGRQIPAQRAAPPAPPQTTPGDLAMSIVRVLHDGNADPEPRVYAKLAEDLRNVDQIDLRPERMRLSHQTLLPRHKLLHLSATGAFTLGTDEAAALKTQLDRGSIALFDSAGGHAEAGAAFRQQMETLYPGDSFQPIPENHPIFTGKETGGTTLNHLALRAYKGRGTSRTPEPMMLTHEGKVVAICLDTDLTAGLAQVRTDGIIGYTPESAVALMRNIILFAGAQ